MTCDGVPLLAEFELSVNAAWGHCLPESFPIWIDRKQCPAFPFVSFAPGKLIL
jgi:hypothetical protein